MTLLFGCLILMTLAIVLLGLFRDLLYSALSLALTSVLLSIVLFQFGANIAAVFELSVCAGLITVLFVSTVSLTKDSDQKAESRLGRIALIPVVAALSIGAYFLVQWIQGAMPSAAPTQASGAGFQEIFWGQRMTDILAQLGLILAGVFGILAVFRLKSAGGSHE